jgi:hypothetical protein
MGGHHLTYTFMAVCRRGCLWDRGHGTPAKAFDFIGKALEKFEQGFRFLGHKGLQPKAISSQSEQAEDIPRVFHVSLGCGGPGPVPTGSRLAPHKRRAVRPHFKGLEEKGLADSPRAGNSHHLYRCWNLRCTVLQRLVSGMRSPTAEEKDYIEVRHILPLTHRFQVQGSKWIKSRKAASSIDES